jgi:hypothetical protein
MHMFLSIHTHTHVRINILFSFYIPNSIINQSLFLCSSIPTSYCHIHLGIANNEYTKISHMFFNSIQRQLCDDRLELFCNTVRPTHAHRKYLYESPSSFV